MQGAGAGPPSLRQWLVGLQYIGALRTPRFRRPFANTSAIRKSDALEYARLRARLFRLDPVRAAFQHEAQKKYHPSRWTAGLGAPESRPRVARGSRQMPPVLGPPETRVKGSGRSSRRCGGRRPGREGCGGVWGCRFRG